MSGFSKTFMIVGAMIFIIGFLASFVPLGKLPGDIFIKKGHSTFYFPVVTSIVVSIILSIIFHFLGKFR